jgi:exopolysaccharide production protein ExoQ
MKALDDRRFRLGFAVVTLFTVLAGDAWRYSISWYGFFAVGFVITVISVLLIVRERGQWAFGTLPYPLLAFIALATLSVTWSYYPGATAIGLVTTYATVIMGFGLAVALSWTQLLTALGRALRIILGLSIAFELVVSLFVRAPLLPFWPSPGVDYDNLPTPIPKLLYWSRNELFAPDGKIQGILGNSSLLGFIALLALIVFAIQFAGKTVSRASGIASIIVAALVIYLTRSATITIALVVLAAVVVLVLLLRRFETHRGYIWAGVAVVVAGGIAVMIAIPEKLLALVGKSPDLTHRTDIWADVIALAQQRPAFGWGWVSYWFPWVAPFDTLASNSGVRQLHAHNAWLDIWLQLGVVGLVVFGALVLSTFVRSWMFARERPLGDGFAPVAHTAQSLLPLLILVALLVQSVAESRLIIEYGLVLLTIISVRTKLNQSHPAAP